MRGGMCEKVWVGVSGGETECGVSGWVGEKVVGGEEEGRKEN